MKKLEGWICPNIKGMTPYTPIEPPDQIARRLSLPEKSIIKLDANENPYGASREVLEALGQGKYFHIYPDPAQVELRKFIAGYAGCKPEMVVAGTGADELLDLICRLFLSQGDKVVSFVPTFSYYSHVVALNKGIYQVYKREADFSISMDVARKIDLKGVKIIFLCSPNNPTGNMLEQETLEYFLGLGVVVVVDEAYYEFSQDSFIKKAGEFDNLILLRTFSKCFGLAGLRVGYGVMSGAMAGHVMRIKPPYSVNMAAEVALKTCLANLGYYKEQVGAILDTREWAYNELRRIPQLSVFPSRSNFILCRVEGYSAKKLWGQLEKQGILVRYFETDLLRNYIRVSIGTREQMENFLEKTREILKSKS